MPPPHPRRPEPDPACPRSRGIQTQYHQYLHQAKKKICGAGGAAPAPPLRKSCHYLDIDSQPTTRSALIGSVGARSLHGNIWTVTAETGITLFVIRAFGRDELALDTSVWLEYRPD